MTTNAEHQRAYRERRQQRFERMSSSLSAILAKLDGNDKPLAVEIRKIAEEGLKP